MTSTVLLILFLIFFAAEVIVERVLSLLNAAHVRAHSERVPTPVANSITPEAYRKSVEYTLARSRFGHWTAAEGVLLKVVFLFSGLLPYLARLIHEHLPVPYLDGAALLLGAGLLGALAGVPLDLYGTFVLEARFGFNRTNFRTWLIDRIKAGILGALLGAPVIAAMLWLMLHSGALWWLWAALFLIAVQFAFMILYPTFISPLFNKFAPLESGELRSALEDLARRCDFAARDIFVMDGSRRSAHSNAYFTGIGKWRRIVLFDTLIKQLSTPELSAVLAHEIGHYKLRHIPKGLLLSCGMTVAAFFVLSRVLHWPLWYETFGGAPWPVDSSTPLGLAQGLFICSAVAGPFTFWSGLLFNALSRKYEYQADAYAAEQTGAPPMQGALLALSKENLSNLTPHPAFSAYHYSHPALLERLSALER